MLEPPDNPDAERRRLEALRQMAILDTPAEERFDRITRLARRLFDVPIALVSLVDGHRQWFKSHQGIDVSETSREISFCGHAICGRDTFLVPNALDDERFADNPLVTDEPHIRFYAGQPLLAPDGSPVGTLCLIDRQSRELDGDDLETLRDLAAMVERELAAVQMATIDALTGISNRRGFEMIARYALANARRSGHPLTLLFIDLDRFKQINDQLGHDEGDRALIETARCLLGSFRDSDVVGRIGGDEFGVILRETGAAELKAPLERLEANIARRNGESRDWQLAYSVGAVLFDPERHRDVSDLLREADARMYEKKRARDRT